MTATIDPFADLVVHDGIYLEQAEHLPAEPQWRNGRRDPGLKSLIEWHTSESHPSWGVFQLAEYITARTGAGSYHLIGDRHGQILQLIDFDNEAFGDRTGTNRTAIHCALVMRAGEWPTMPQSEIRKLTVVAARMAGIAADHIEARGLLRPAARLLTRDMSDLPDASGHISHARRDPVRRSDPGDKFPWNGVFELYEGAGSSARTWAGVQRRLDAMGMDPGPDDGVPGPRTLGAVSAALDQHDEFERRILAAGVLMDQHKLFIFVKLSLLIPYLCMFIND